MLRKVLHQYRIAAEQYVGTMLLGPCEAREVVRAWRSGVAYGRMSALERLIFDNLGARERSRPEAVLYEQYRNTNQWVARHVDQHHKEVICA